MNLIERTGFPVHMAIIWLEFSGEVATNYTAWNRFFAAKCQKVSSEFKPFAVHLKKTNIHLYPNLFHYGQYTLINTNMTFICTEVTFNSNICICINIQNH